MFPVVPLRLWMSLGKSFNFSGPKILFSVIVVSILLSLDIPFIGFTIFTVVNESRFQLRGASFYSLPRLYTSSPVLDTMSALSCMSLNPSTPSLLPSWCISPGDWSHRLCFILEQQTGALENIAGCRS